MTLRIVIPVRPTTEAKSRLAGVLDPVVRARLARAMFDHVLQVSQQFAPTLVVSRDADLLALASQPVREEGLGLNPALEQVATSLCDDSPLLTVSADLPLLGPDDLRAMVVLLDRADVIAAPDRAGTGTNALLLARPGIISYHFGEGSLAAHLMATESKGLRFATCERAGLATDIDRPSDLRHLPREYDQMIAASYFGSVDN